ncbi:MAG: hypothetical protein CME71_10215 [Halobacteriovorax sp.]|nr:hypothetical protein [Halobacteriovorax sp.]
MLGPQNAELIALKKEAIQAVLPLETSSSISFKYHDIPIEFSSPDQELLNSIRRTLPESWFSINAQVSPVYKVSHYPLEAIGLKEEVFEDEADSECYIEHLGGRELAFHRDFVALKEEDHVKAIFTSRVDDGFYNFVRWLISRDLLIAQKVVLHSSVILGHDQKAYVFLGPSGAGKTTTCHNAEDRLVLGDDMNILLLQDDKILAQAGAIGGKFSPQVPIDQKYEVAGLYWLTQSQKLELTPLTSAKAAQVLLVSLANMFWPSARQQDKQLALDFVTQIVSNSKFFELKLKNDSSFWKLIELRA